MKILAIIGTYRKNNTYQIIKQFENHLKNNKRLEFEYLFIKDYDIGFCKGCNLCVLKGEENCPHYEPINIIRTKIENSNGVIFATPVYCENVSGLMKNLFDHFIFIIHRPCFMGKYVINIATSEYSGLKETLKYLKNTTMKLGFYNIGNFELKNSYYNNYPEYVKKINIQINNLGLRFIDYIENKKVPKLKLYDIIYFRIWQSILSYSNLLKKMSKLDHDYWNSNELFKKSYFSGIKTNLIKDIFAKIIAKRVGNMMKKIAIKEELDK